MKQSCGKCKFYRVVRKPFGFGYGVCSWATMSGITMPVSVIRDRRPYTSESSGKTCKTFVAKDGKK